MMAMNGPVRHTTTPAQITPHGVCRPARGSRMTVRRWSVVRSRGFADPPLDGIALVTRSWYVFLHIGLARLIL